MTQPLLNLNIGAADGDGTGDPLRTGLGKVKTAVNKIGVLSDDGKFIPAVADDFDLIMKKGAISRAEIVIGASNNFKLTVSTDGVAWLTAMDVNPTTGLASFPLTAGVANGLATLDTGGKVPLAQIPASFASAIPSYAWVARPSAAANTGKIIAVTDVGKAGSLWISDGVTWRPMNGRVTLATGAIPMILPSSGSIGNNGALTGLTALPEAYATCYMYFPVNAIATGVAAGLYYVVMSSTTAGTIYNNIYTSGIPTIPASTVSFSTTGSGAYVQTTGSNITIVSFTLPGNIMGVDGEIRVYDQFVVTSNTDTKTPTVLFGGTAVKTVTMNTTSLTSEQGLTVVRNRGATNLQETWVNNSAVGLGTSPSNPVTTTVNTTANVTVSFAGNIAAVAANSIMLAGWTVELLTQ